MALLVYTHPADNVAAEVSPVASTSDPEYTVINLTDGKPSNPFKFTATTGNLVWSYASARNVDLLGIFHHNLIAGLELRLQANTANSWTTPPLNILLTVPEYDNSNWPRNIFYDLALAGVSPRSYQFWRLIIVGTNPAVVALGEVHLYTTRRTLNNVDVRYPVDEEMEMPLIEHETDYGVLTVYELGTKRVNRIEAVCQAINPNALELIRDWWDSCNGRSKPFLMHLDSEAADCYGPMLVRWASQRRPDRHVFPGITDVPLVFQEVSKGLLL